MFDEKDLNSTDGVLIESQTSLHPNHTSTTTITFLNLKTLRNEPAKIRYAILAILNDPTPEKTIVVQCIDGLGWGDHKLPSAIHGYSIPFTANGVTYTDAQEFINMVSSLSYMQQRAMYTLFEK